VAHSTGVLIANAPFRWTPRLTAIATGADVVLAADGGANHLARIGLRPVSVIGDLDSISGPTRTWIGEAAIVERPDQDRTDLDKALTFAFDDLGLATVTVLAATGGRVDHDTGNLGLLARLALGTRLIYEGDAYRLLAVNGEIGLDAVPGETWSFWTYDPAVRVTIEGVRWPVVDAALDAGARPSISNIAIADQVRIRAEGGSIIIMRIDRSSNVGTLGSSGIA
jgi:thiamine pyrophosphokinase